jgi:hypothetical protein
MALDTPTILAQIDDVLARCGASVENPRTPKHPNPSNYIGTPAAKGNAAEMVASCLALIDRIASGSSYQRSALEMTNGGKSATSAVVDNLLGIVVALRRDVEAGYTSSLVELVHADVFADFLDMASELQHAGYKDAAAVIAGSTLEEHLRKLAVKAPLPITGSNGEPLTASRLNADLNGPVYNAIQPRRAGVARRSQRRSAWPLWRV